MRGAGQLVQRAMREAPPIGSVPRRDVGMLTNGVFPLLRRLIGTGYFSLSVEGAHHVPRSGPVIYVGNHAGWFTMDTLMGALAVADHVGLDRLPWGAVQDQLLQAPKIGRFFESIGGFPSSWLRTPQAIPEAMQIFSIYPEGTEGNCKSFLHAYQMRPWHTSFLRVAAARGATIVPVAIVGGEECLPVLSTIRWVKPLLGTILPLPLSLLPLPTRWELIFHEPWQVDGDEFVGMTNGSSGSHGSKRAREFAAEIRERVQRTIDQHTADRALVRFSRALSARLAVAKGRLVSARDEALPVPSLWHTAAGSSLLSAKPASRKRRKRVVTVSPERLSG
jgi:1-acyl-sn-glycerol-3-phosphate acyltransferase